MSGSYDRPTGRRDQATSQTATNFDLYDTVLTGPSGTNQHRTYDVPPMGDDDAPPLRKMASGRSRKPKNEPSSTPVVPPDTVTGRLVGEEQLRLADDGARDRGALLLTAGQD